MMNNTLSKKNLTELIETYDIDTGNTDFDDSMVELLLNVKSLELPDLIILLLYAETQSYRKLAKLLNVSFTTAYKTIKRIREQLLNDDNNDDS